MTITVLAAEATRHDAALIRHAYDRLTDRGVDTIAAHLVLSGLVDAVATERMAAEAAQAATTRTAAAPLADPTKPTDDEATTLYRLLARAVNVYNGRRGPFTRLDRVATERGLKSINRAAVARRVRTGSEVDARVGPVSASKEKQPGRTQRKTFTVAAPLHIGTAVRALSAVVIETPTGLQIEAFDPIH